MKLKILAVDDSMVITEMIKDAFELEGYQVLTAGDGAEALKFALAESPDLIIADISMPGMDGWELCSQIRSNPYTSFIPFIFLTAMTETPDRIRGLQLGADDYLVKPFEMEELLARVHLIFQRIIKTQESMITRGSQGLSGTTQHLALTDLLQMFSLNQKTGMLQISSSGQITGRLAFQSGRIIRAKLGEMRGLKAIYRMLAFNDAQFQVLPLSDFSENPEIPDSAEAILMESARQQDELTRLKADYPLQGKTLHVVPGLVPSPLPQGILARVVLVAQNGCGFQQLLDNVSDPDLEVYQAVANLIEQGALSVEG